jgi:succinate dehydrogenase / fumarate reductase membrane anchor subunit
MRHVGGARRGLDMWLLQRASALYMALFLPIFLILPDRRFHDFAVWRGLFVPTAMKVGGCCSSRPAAHAWIGLREIFIDYVHFLVPRLALYLVFRALYLGCLVWAVDILWSVKIPIPKRTFDAVIVGGGGAEPVCAPPCNCPRPT